MTEFRLWLISVLLGWMLDLVPKQKRYAYIILGIMNIGKAMQAKNCVPDHHYEFTARQRAEIEKSAERIELTKLCGDESMPIIHRVRATAFTRHLREIVLSHEDFTALQASDGILPWVQPDGSLRIFGLPVIPTDMD